MRLSGGGGQPAPSDPPAKWLGMISEPSLLEWGLSPHLADFSLPWPLFQQQWSSLSSQHGKLIPASGPLHRWPSLPGMPLSLTLAWLAPLTIHWQDRPQLNVDLGSEDAILL